MQSEERPSGDVMILNLTDKLAITKLATVFESFDSEQDAVNSFA